jgi:hypothetical protein
MPTLVMSRPSSSELDTPTGLVVDTREALLQLAMMEFFSTPEPAPKVN